MWSSAQEDVYAAPACLDAPVPMDWGEDPRVSGLVVPETTAPAARRPGRGLGRAVSRVPSEIGRDRPRGDHVSGIAVADDLVHATRSARGSRVRRRNDFRRGEDKQSHENRTEKRRKSARKCSIVHDEED